MIRVHSAAAVLLHRRTSTDPQGGVYCHAGAAAPCDGQRRLAKSGGSDALGHRIRPQPSAPGAARRRHHADTARDGGALPFHRAGAQFHARRRGRQRLRGDLWAGPRARVQRQASPLDSCCCRDARRAATTCSRPAWPWKRGKSGSTARRSSNIASRSRELRPWNGRSRLFVKIWRRRSRAHVAERRACFGDRDAALALTEASGRAQSPVRCQ